MRFLKCFKTMIIAVFVVLICSDVLLAGNLTASSTDTYAQVTIKGTVSNSAEFARLKFKNVDGSTNYDGARITSYNEGGNKSGNLVFHTNNNNAGLIERMRIDKFGNVGVGTTSPQSMLDIAGDINSGSINSTGTITSGELSVEGKITAEEIEVVDTITAMNLKVSADSWADYVFESGYSLRSLESLESFINSNRQLPDMPSEEEVLEGELDVAGMLTKQMRKIEELTLYIIEQNKINNEQAENISRLEERLAILEAAIQ
ncbi:MAG: hypothetical protein K9L30_12135 [Desulfobacterales bacterium]|nr:hypothetical protein [Desulfobacterales bacterium]